MKSGSKLPRNVWILGFVSMLMDLPAPLLILLNENRIGTAEAHRIGPVDRIPRIVEQIYSGIDSRRIGRRITTLPRVVIAVPVVVQPGFLVFNLSRQPEVVGR